MMSTIASDHPSHRYHVIPSIESIFDLDHDRNNDVNNQTPEVFLHNQLKFNLSTPTKIENLTSVCKDPTSIVISNPAKTNYDARVRSLLAITLYDYEYFAVFRYGMYMLRSILKPEFDLMFTLCHQ